VTYRELVAELAWLTNEQLDSTVTVQLGESDEYLPAVFGICGEDQSVLDENHPIIYVEDA